MVCPVKDESYLCETPCMRDKCPYEQGRLDEKENKQQQISELEDVVASINCQYESFVNELCQIIFVGEDTEIGRQITLDRIKEHINYNEWLDDLV